MASKKTPVCKGRGFFCLLVDACVRARTSDLMSELMARRGTEALLTRDRIAAWATFGHPVRIHRPCSATLCPVRIAGAGNSSRCFARRSLWICHLGLASNWLTTLCVGFSNAGILGVGCTDQDRCRSKSYYPFHRMSPLSVQSAGRV